ncbi:microtubule-associated serine/threonine-protein kinase 3-like [Poecile atricapillus]|uniref:microtubule-associated serine/threonine-protein kinase 3-like n=1 Tax=Poecile atricapillus TaxID=48891 RepID=UPI00273A3BC9|nr:microtubule-associated serine/threonine-protein kinase 3-like [Poecile atricapillus]
MDDSGVIRRRRLQKELPLPRKSSSCRTSNRKSLILTSTSPTLRGPTRRCPDTSGAAPWTAPATSHPAPPRTSPSPPPAVSDPNVQE